MWTFLVVWSHKASHAKPVLGDDSKILRINIGSFKQIVTNFLLSVSFFILPLCVRFVSSHDKVL